jgi:hypothetical protein
MGYRVSRKGGAVLNVIWYHVPQAIYPDGTEIGINYPGNPIIDREDKWQQR